MTQAFNYIDENSEKYIEALKGLIRQPSVSAKKEEDEGIEKCAELVQTIISKKLGVEAKILRSSDGSGNPLVTAEIKSKANPTKTVIFYNHYDVQPPEPLELWESPPFDPSERDGKIYGRGSSDDKAELVGRIAATEALLETTGGDDVPCNLRFVIEGEEEVGSPTLPKYKKEYPELFRADGIIWEFGGVDAKERPLVTLGVKGMLYVELEATTARTDVHSSLGAIIENPAWRIVGALSTIRGKDNKILVPGWFEDVRKFSKQETELLAMQPYDEAEVKRDLGINHFLNGMRGLELKKALAGAPTCTICGINSGYGGAGPKTVLPSKATSKIDFRLVPDQDPRKLTRKLRTHLKAKGYSDVEIKVLQEERAARTSPDETIVSAAAKAAKTVHGRNAVISVSSAATGPMYLFEGGCVAIGSAYPSSRNHAPNENVRIDLFVKGIKWVVDTLVRFSQ